MALGVQHDSWFGLRGHEMEPRVRFQLGIEIVYPPPSLSAHDPPPSHTGTCALLCQVNKEVESPTHKKWGF